MDIRGAARPPSNLAEGKWIPLISTLAGSTITSMATGKCLYDENSPTGSPAITDVGPSLNLPLLTATVSISHVVEPLPRRDTTLPPRCPGRLLRSSTSIHSFGKREWLLSVICSTTLSPTLTRSISRDRSNPMPLRLNLFHTHEMIRIANIATITRSRTARSHVSEANSKMPAMKTSRDHPIATPAWRSEFLAVVAVRVYCGADRSQRYGYRIPAYEPQDQR